MEFRVRVEDHGVKPLLRFLVLEHPNAVAKAMNRVILDVREAETKMVSRSFDYWSAVTRQFIANEKSFPFQKASKGHLEAKIFGGGAGGRSATAEIFGKQETGFTLKPGKEEQLEFGKRPASYAIPTDDRGAHLRTPAGRVPQRRTPGGLFASRKGGSRPKQQGGAIRMVRRRRRVKGVGNLGTHVFVSRYNKAIIEKTPGGGRRLLYTLFQKPIKVKEHISFYDTAIRTIDKNMTMKLLQEWDRAFGRF